VVSSIMDARWIEQVGKAGSLPEWRELAEDQNRSASS